MSIILKKMNNPWVFNFQSYHWVVVREWYDKRKGIWTFEGKPGILEMEWEAKRRLEMELVGSQEKEWKREIIVIIDTLGRVCIA